MKLQNINNYLVGLLAALTLLSVGSCKKILDVEQDRAVDQSQMYRNVFDADAAVIGVYGKLMGVARNYFLLNELRADLTDVTNNADRYLRQLSEHAITQDNPYVNPQPFYEVILNCNDVLYNFKKMLAENKLKLEDYNQRYADIGAIRSWLYLQLGIHYGKIPYVTDRLASVTDLRDQTKFPLIEFEPLLDSLISFTETLPYKDEYPTTNTLRVTVDGYNTQKFFINKTMLLGELYLWDNRYLDAAKQFKTLLDYANTRFSGDEAFFSYYRMSSFASADGTVNYSRAQDASSLVFNAGWRYLFERGQDNPYNWEWIWVLPFDKNFAPENPFIDLMSPNGGRYLVQPSRAAIENRSSQMQRNGFPFDARGLLTYQSIGGQPVITKYLLNYLSLDGMPVNALSKTGKWFLKRAAKLHLNYAEAANRDRQFKLAHAILNRGIKDSYDPTPGAGRARDVTNIQQTFLPFPYDFDAREGDAPAYRSTWYRSIGIRQRAGVTFTDVPASDSLMTLENQIIHENALELAYEGERWSDLLRVAMRRNDPAFIADKIYNKLVKSGISAGAAGQARAKLLAKDWFLPFKWQ